MDSSLSNDFAMKILDKEINLETNCTLQNLKSLVDLYRNAIEYFEEIKSPKFWDFQERLQKILMKPNVFKMMQEENNLYKTTKERTRKRTITKVNSTPNIRKSNRSQTEPAQEMEVINTEKQTEGENKIEIVIPEEVPKPGEKVANRIVETQKKRAEKVSSKALTDLKSQELTLTERLANRKQKLLNISTDTSFSGLGRSVNYSLSVPSTPQNPESKSFFSDFESDKSAGLNQFSQLSEKIEKIMEDSFNEKSDKITEVKVKYETQISELEADAGIYIEIIKEMRRNMRKEIEEINASFDVIRKQRIREAKEEAGL